MKLNLGAGKAKIEGYINIDISEECNPDLVCDFRKGLPYASGTIDEVVMFHVIEHIEKKFHELIFLEVKRVLKSDGVFILTFPDFAKCATNWLVNKAGIREFWEATIYGRQLYPSDYHVCVCTVDGMARKLAQVGFDSFWQGYENNSQIGMDCNGVIKCTKVKVITYEEALRETVFGD
jgi:predicted SAM-dependent methyltransferase